MEKPGSLKCWKGTNPDGVSLSFQVKVLKQRENQLFGTTLGKYPFGDKLVKTQMAPVGAIIRQKAMINKHNMLIFCCMLTTRDMDGPVDKAHAENWKLILCHFLVFVYLFVVDKSCYQCGETGHISRNCPKKKGKANIVQMSIWGEETISCVIWGRSGKFFV